MWEKKGDFIHDFTVLSQLSAFVIEVLEVSDFVEVVCYLLTRINDAIPGIK